MYFLGEIFVIMYSVLSLACLILTSTAVLMSFSGYFRGMPTPQVIYNTFWRDVRAAYRYLRMRIFLRMFEKRNKCIVHLFPQLVRKHPNKVCFVLEDQEWTFQQVEDFSNRIANFFDAQGYRKGDEVALLLENRPEFFCIWLGFCKIGVITALLNTNLRLISLAHTVNVISCKALIYGAELSEAVRDAVPFINNKENLQYFSLDPDAVPLEFPSTSLDDVLREASSQPVDLNKYQIDISDKALYIFTSGTTGLPKAAIIRHRKMMCSVAINKYILKLKESDVIYNTLPLYHGAGSVYLASYVLAYGPTMVIKKKFSASNFWKDAIKHRATVAQYIGEICRYLLAQPPKPEDKFHSIRLMTGNGLRPQIWEEFAERFNISQVAEIYGATEGNIGIVNLNNKAGAVGFNSRLCPWMYPVTLIRVDQETGEPIRKKNGLCIRCKVGEPGEFVGKITPNDPIRAFDGYSDQKATSNKVIRNCFKRGDTAFRSGDILVMDEEGYFYFLDRKGDTFRWKGENVSTSEVEGVISKLLGLASCVVYGVEIPGLEGKAGMAAIQCNGDDDKDIDLVTCYDLFSMYLPSYAMPIFIRICTNIETTGTYKLVKLKMQKEGYHPGMIKDPLYFLNSSAHTYVRLDDEIFKQIMVGGFRY